MTQSILQINKINNIYTFKKIGRQNIVYSTDATYARMDCAINVKGCCFSCSLTKKKACQRERPNK